MGSHHRRPRPGGDTHPWHEAHSTADVVSGPWPARNVVVGIDARPSSRAELAYASGWAHANDTALTIVYLDPPSGIAAAESLNAITPAPIPATSSGHSR